MGEFNVTRRSFLGLGGAATLLGTASLMGCTPTTAAAPSNVDSALPETGETEQVSLNPQDTSYLEGESDYAAIFEPLQLGSIQIQNRLAKAAAGSYSIDAGINDQAIGFYEGLAKGGVGIIWHEDLSFYPCSPL